MVTCSGRSLRWVVCRGVVRQSRQKLDDQIHRASRRRSSHTAADPEMAEGRSDGGRPMVGTEDGYAARLGGHPPYTKGNFDCLVLRNPRLAVEPKESERCDGW